MIEEALRNEVLRISRMVKAERLIVWTQGNISARNPDTNMVAVTPSGMDYDLCTTEDIVVTDVNGNVVDGKRRPSSETLLHCALYRLRPDANGIVHTHSNYATSFAVVGREIPVVMAQLAEVVGDSIPVAAWARAGRVELAENIAKVMGDRSACLMGNHGLVALGRTVYEAFSNAWQIEDGARVYWLALQVGEPKIIPEKDAKDIRQNFLTRYGQQGVKK